MSGCYNPASLLEIDPSRFANACRAGGALPMPVGYSHFPWHAYSVRASCCTLAGAAFYQLPLCQGFARNYVLCGLMGPEMSGGVV